MGSPFEVAVGGLPDPLALINWPRLWGFKKVPSEWGRRVGATVAFKSTSNHWAFQKGINESRREAWFGMELGPDGAQDKVVGL